MARLVVTSPSNQDFRPFLEGFDEILIFWVTQENLQRRYKPLKALRTDDDFRRKTFYFLSHPQHRRPIQKLLLFIKKKDIYHQS
jgi:hypothetical protein